MQFVVVTGMSGAGKSSVAHILEDIGYYCIDNIPPTLISNFVTLCQNSSLTMDKIAFVVDARSGELIKKLGNELSELRKNGNRCELLFLDATDEYIIKRYKETRRKHPHAGNGRIEDGIAEERRLLGELRGLADYEIDTTGLITRQLREQVLALFEEKQKYENISVSVVSFGFKYGIPLDSDLMFDVRFLPNPFYEHELRELTGLTKEVSGYVLKFAETQEFLNQLKNMLKFLLPQYAEEGKMQLVVSIGCTGGKHRSVTVAEELGKFLRKNNYFTMVIHRDIEK